MFSAPGAGAGKAGADTSCAHDEEGLLAESDTESGDTDFNIFS